MSTRRHTVDQRFVEILAEDFGIGAGKIFRALEGEPQKAAIAILEWAIRTEDPAYALDCWSKKHRRGTRAPRRRWCGQRQERQQDGRGRRGGNRSGGGDTTTPRPGGSVGSGSLRGVLADPERLAKVAERMGV